MSRASRVRFWTVAVAGATCACATLGSPEATAPAAPELTGGQARCKVAASHESPLVTEWSSADKANLEARAQLGAVLVAYSGCEMRILSHCPAPGAYRWHRTTTTSDFVEVRNEDELYAKLPLGAASLEGALGRAGSLAIQTTVSGQLELERFDPAAVERDTRCRGATHVVRGVAVGAFQMRSGDRISARGGVSLAAAGTSRDTALLRRAGDPETCRLSSDQEPHPDCRSPVQVFLTPLPRTLARSGPPGSLNVRFVPPDPDEKWKLAVGDRELCDLPCQRRVDPAMPYSYRAEGGFLRPDNVVELPDLRPHAGAGEVEVRPTPRRTGRFVGGIVMTSLGGVAALTGTVLLAASCGKSTGGCVAGAISLPVGALAVGAGVVLIVTSRSTIEVAPASLPTGTNMDGEPTWE